MVPDSDLESALRLKVEVVGVVQPLVQGPLQVDEVGHPHCSGGKQEVICCSSTCQDTVGHEVLHKNDVDRSI